MKPLALVVDDPTACEFCGGDGLLPVVTIVGLADATVTKLAHCPFCCCTTCGQTTDTPPLCAACSERQHDVDAAEAWRKGRY